MGTSGIYRALVKGTKANIRNYQNGIIVELKNNFDSFTAYIDETCIGRNTVNPKRTIEEVKWLLIREHIWNNYKMLYPALTHQEFFERLIQECSDLTFLEGNNTIINYELITKGMRIVNWVQFI